MTTYLLTPILVYLGVSVFYNLVFALASTKKGNVPYQPRFVQINKIAVFIPAYKEDGIIVDTAIKALDQNYPSNRYTVFIIADSLKPQTLVNLRELPVEVVEVSFEKSTKAKAINKTYEQVKGDYDVTVVLDADNVMERSFLTKVNNAYNDGNMAMQGHRIAKNQENSLAVLDAISEEINNNIYRKGHRNLGLSSALIGSGMAFDFHLLKNEMNQIDAIGGFDKELELRLLKQNITIEYLEHACVYDEKVSESEAFTNQRTRWIAAQIRYGVNSFGDAITQLLTKGNIDYFDKSLQFLLPPRLILLGLLVVLTAVTALFQIDGWSIVTTLLLAYIIALAVSVPKKFYNSTAIKACLKLPKTFALMVVAIGGYKKAKTNFLHTPHQNQINQ
ncbi:MAG: glycosyltransferase [Marinoscillum sp.]